MGFFKKNLELYFFDIYLNMLHLSYMAFLSTSSGLHQIHMQHNFFEQGSDLNMLHLSYMAFLSTSSGLHQIHMQHNFLNRAF